MSRVLTKRTPGGRGAATEAKAKAKAEAEAEAEAARGSIACGLKVWARVRTRATLIHLQCCSGSAPPAAAAPRLCPPTIGAAPPISRRFTHGRGLLHPPRPTRHRQLPAKIQGRSLRLDLQRTGTSTCADTVTVHGMVWCGRIESSDCRSSSQRRNEPDSTVTGRYPVCRLTDKQTHARVCSRRSLASPQQLSSAVKTRPALVTLSSSSARTPDETIETELEPCGKSTNSCSVTI